LKIFFAEQKILNRSLQKFSKNHLDKPYGSFRLAKFVDEIIGDFAIEIGSLWISHHGLLALATLGSAI
jgi:hypothetical protein